MTPIARLVRRLLLAISLVVSLGTFNQGNANPLTDVLSRMGVTTISADMFGVSVAGVDGSIVAYRFRMVSSQIHRMDDGPANDPSAVRPTDWVKVQILDFVDTLNRNPLLVFADGGFDENGNLSFHVLIFDFTSDDRPFPAKRAAFAWFTHNPGEVVPYPVDMVARLSGVHVPLAVAIRN